MKIIGTASHFHSFSFPPLRSWDLPCPWGKSSVPVLMSCARRLRFRLGAKPEAARSCQLGQWIPRALSSERILRSCWLSIRLCWGLLILSEMNLWSASPVTLVPAWCNTNKKFESLLGMIANWNGAVLCDWVLRIRDCIWRFIHMVFARVWF